MTSGRRWTVVGVLVVTAVTCLVAVLGWGAGSLEKVSWVAGILGVTASVVIAVIGQGSTPPTEAQEPGWDRPPMRSGVGAVLGLGALGVVVIALMVLGTVLVLGR